MKKLSNFEHPVPKKSSKSFEGSPRETEIFKKKHTREIQ